MRKFLPLALICMLLCGCGSQESPETQPPATTGAATEATIPTESTTAPTEPEVIIYRHPLTGEILDAPYTKRPVAVSTGNTRAAMPQMGISYADLLLEMEEEGGVTRFMAVYTQYEQASAIGPIRSTRTFFNNAAVSFNAPLVHCGGSVRGIVGYHDLTGSKISPWEHIDEQYNGKYFYRDQQRLSDGYATEHCLFITGEKLAAAMAAKEYATEEAWDLGLQFREDALTGGSAANNVTVSFLGGKKTGFQYDSATKLYKASQYGSALIDGINGDQLAFKNILVLTTAQSHKSEGRYVRSYYDMVGQGEGYLMCDGQMITLRWERESLEEPFRFTDANGNPITLGVGKTYMAIVSTKATAPKCE